MGSISFDALRAALARDPDLRIERSRCPKRAAVALVFAPSGQDLHLAMIRRAEHPSDPWSGQMGFPGGREEPEDADEWQTAIRETREELGLGLERAERLGRLSELQAMSKGRALPLAIAPLVFALPATEPLVPSAEVAEAFWLPLAALLDPGRATQIDWQHEGSSLRLPAIEVEGRVIWGLSWRMLASLFGLLRWSPICSSAPPP